MFRFPQAFCLAAVVRNAKRMPSLPTLPYSQAPLVARSGSVLFLAVTRTAEPVVQLLFRFLDFFGCDVDEMYAFE